MCTLLLLAAGSERPWADPECAATIHPRLLRSQADAWFLVAVAAGSGFLREELVPVFFADDGVDEGVCLRLAGRGLCRTGRCCKKMSIERGFEGIGGSSCGVSVRSRIATVLRRR